MQIIKFFNSLFFYPLFIVLYILYKLILKLSYLLHYFFKIIYIENICGFKKTNKIVDSINSLSKIPQQIALVIDTSSNWSQMIKSQQNETLSQTAVCEEYIQIIKTIQPIKKINIYFQGQNLYIQNLIKQLSKAIFQQDKQRIQIIKPQINKCSRIQKLINKNNAPLVIVFADYQETCNLPPKYLINAEIAFNQNIMISTKYDIYRSFLQYSNSKQRNGK